MSKELVLRTDIEINNYCLPIKIVITSHNTQTNPKIIRFYKSTFHEPKLPKKLKDVGYPKPLGTLDWLKKYTFIIKERYRKSLNFEELMQKKLVNEWINTICKYQEQYQLIQQIIENLLGDKSIPRRLYQYKETILKLQPLGETIKSLSVWTFKFEDSLLSFLEQKRLTYELTNNITKQYSELGLIVKDSNPSNPVSMEEYVDTWATRLLKDSDKYEQELRKVRKNETNRI